MRSYLVFLSLLLSSVSCSTSPTRLEDINTLQVTLPSGKKITARTMQTESDMLRGMMFEESLPEDRGMLFNHAKENKFPYWMYNVRIPLDIIWLDRTRHVVEIAADTPPCPSKSAATCPTFGGHLNALYVLELNAGAAARHGIRLGDLIQF